MKSESIIQLPFSTIARFPFKTMTRLNTYVQKLQPQKNHEKTTFTTNFFEQEKISSPVLPQRPLDIFLLPYPLHNKQQVNH